MPQADSVCKHLMALLVVAIVALGLPRLAASVPDHLAAVASGRRRAEAVVSQLMQVVSCAL